MENEKYNGWSNYDTWLVALWLNNDESNYKRIVNKIKGIGTDRKLSDMRYDEKVAYIRQLHYGDKIKWSNVCYLEIVENVLNEMIENEK